MVYLSADLHLGHANIVKYAKRPQLRPGDLDEVGNWVSQEIKDTRARQMNEMLIRNWNQRVKPGDTVYHLGDFCCYGAERGVSGTKTKAAEWLEQLNGSKVMILGNHDGNNSLTRGLDYGVITAGGLNILLTHNPNEHRPGTFDVVACGHVHTAWAEQQREDALYINIGVDVRKYAPISLSELIGLATKKRKVVKRDINATNETSSGAVGESRMMVCPVWYRGACVSQRCRHIGEHAEIVDGSAGMVCRNEPSMEDCEKCVPVEHKLTE